MDPNSDKNQPLSHDDGGKQLSAPQDDQSYDSPDREVAARYIRGQIDDIYDDDPPNQTKQQQESRGQTPQNPYQRTHDPAAAAHTQPQSHADNHWQKYHQAWQQYYQQYYQRYYTHHLLAEKQKIAEQPSQQDEYGQTTQKLAENAINSSEGTFSEEPKVLNRQTASSELKEELLGKVKQSAGRFKKSSHFMPIISAIVVGLLFLTVQFNRVFIAQVRAYVSPGSASPQSIILDPTTDIKVSNAPRVIVPKINVDAPVVYDVGSIAEDPIQEALKGGVVHYPIPGANSVPGQDGNTVLIGHSSNDVFDAGDYKFVFVLLDRLQKGDIFYVHYNGTRYTYSVTSKKIINPDQISELTVKTDKPMATLLSCTPPGTALKRLLVFADQISPDPAAAEHAPSGGTTEEPVTLPSNSPTLFERLFGG